MRQLNSTAFVAVVFAVIFDASVSARKVQYQDCGKLTKITSTFLFINIVHLFDFGGRHHAVLTERLPMEGI